MSVLLFVYLYLHTNYVICVSQMLNTLTNNPFLLPKAAHTPREPGGKLRINENRIKHKTTLKLGTGFELPVACDGPVSVPLLTTSF